MCTSKAAMHESKATVQRKEKLVNNHHSEVAKNRVVLGMSSTLGLTTISYLVIRKEKTDFVSARSSPHPTLANGLGGHQWEAKGATIFVGGEE